MEIGMAQIGKNGRPWYRMFISEMTCFIFKMCTKAIEYKYYCFGLFRAERINLILLYSILPVAIMAWAIMFHILPPEDRYGQWDVNFITDAVQTFFMALLIHSSYKKTRHAGMATAVLVYFIFNLFYSIKGVYLKMWWLTLSSKLLIAALAFLVIYKYWNTAKKDRHDGIDEK